MLKSLSGDLCMDDGIEGVDFVPDNPLLTQRVLI